MYDIQKTDYGFRLIFRGHFTSSEATDWLRDFSAAVQSCDSDFQVFVEMQNLIPLEQESKDLIGKGQEYGRSHGMNRSVVILSSPVIIMQFRAIAAQSGILTYERYIDATSSEDWEEVGMNWIIHSKDPDTVVARTL